MKTVIEMARGAGFRQLDWPALETERYKCSFNDIERFAALVREDTIDKFNRQINQACEEARLLDDGEKQQERESQLFETFARIADYLCIDTEAARLAEGKPSDVFIAAIEAAVLAEREKQQDAVARVDGYYSIDANLPLGTLLYAAPPSTQQKPVAWHHPQCDGQCIACLIEKAVQDAYGTQGRDYMLRHINAAPVRTKDLTDDEIDEIGKSYFDEWSFGFARAVIAAYKEKNK